METGLALLIAVGIFLGIPAVIGSAIVGAVALRERIGLAYKPRARRVAPKAA